MDAPSLIDQDGIDQGARATETRVMKFGIPLGLLLLLLSAFHAPAQNPAPAVPTHDSASGGLEAQRQGDITFISGGVGDEDRATLRQVSRDYNLHLQFAVQGSGEYLAEVNVTLTDDKGKTLLDTISDGPLFFARVPPGRYKLTVAEGGKGQTRDLNVPATGTVSESFYWKPAS
jgi:hypothetical protein